MFQRWILYNFSDCCLINSLPSSYNGQSANIFDVRLNLSVGGRMFWYQKYGGGGGKERKTLIRDNMVNTFGAWKSPQILKTCVNDEKPGNFRNHLWFSLTLYQTTMFELDKFKVFADDKIYLSKIRISVKV